MNSFFRFLLICIACFLSIFIVISTNTSILFPSLKAQTPAFTFHPFPTVSIHPTPSIPVQTYSGFCLNIPIILYHHIENLAQAEREGHAQLTVDTIFFDQQMQYLNQNGYHTLTADDVIQILQHQKELPSKPIVVTLDDGYDDIYENAYPIAKKYGVHLNLAIPTGLMENAGYLTWSQIKEMHNSGLISMYNHTWSHASLPSYDTQKITAEITTAQQQLIDHGIPESHIIFYPYGSYNSEVITILKEKQFTGAFSTETGITQCDSFMYSLHRLHVGNIQFPAYGL